MSAALSGTRGIPREIRSRCCSVQDLLRDPSVQEAAVIFSDPAWFYTQAPNGQIPPYPVMKDAQIAELHRQLGAEVPNRAILALWCTWPVLMREPASFLSHDMRPWVRMDGGSWRKTGGSGIGYWWLGRNEPLLVYQKGIADDQRGPHSPATKARPRSAALLREPGDAFTSKPGGHSEKPVEWMMEMISAWTEEGDLVMDLFSGGAAVAVACLRLGRRYLGCEIRPERHEEGLENIRQAMAHPPIR